MFLVLKISKKDSRRVKWAKHEKEELIVKLNKTNQFN